MTLGMAIAIALVAASYALARTKHDELAFFSICFAILFISC